MNAGRSYRGSLPKPDSRGRVRPIVGVDVEGKAQRFQVGTTRHNNEAEMLKRLDHIRDFYDKQCSEMGIEFWADWTLGWAKKLARGIPIKVSESSYARTNPGQAAEEWVTVKRLEAWGVPIQITDPELITNGTDLIKRQIQEQVNQAVETALVKLGQSWTPDAVEEVRQHAIPNDILDAEMTTLHEAVDAYVRHLEQHGKPGSSGVDRYKRLCKYLKDHHEDMPLWHLQLPQIQSMAAYWQNRPPTEKCPRHCGFDHAHDMLKQVFRILNWVDEQPRFQWSMPKEASKIKRTPHTLPHDSPNTPFAKSNTKPTYTPEQLAVLARHTDHFGRTLIATCVNCAFGASEVGQWPMSLYALHTAHPHADKIGISSTDQDSWVTGNRPKPAKNGSANYGEHLLWPAVGDALVRYKEDGRSVLPVWRTRNPWWNDKAQNKQSAFGNWWYNLLDEVQKHDPDFSRLPFGSLRDTLPDVLRNRYDAEIAELVLQHQTLTKDPLLDCYTNRPFRRLFEATRDLETSFKPLLETLDD